MNRITIDPITRLEGHGRIEIFLNDEGDVANAYFQLPSCKIVQEEKRFCTLDNEIVDAHRHQILPQPAEAPRLDPDAQLGAHPVGTGDQHGVAVTCGDLEQGAETAQAGQHLAGLLRADGGPYADQVAALRDKYAIYIVGSGRINVAGITEANVEYLATSVAAVL